MKLQFSKSWIQGLMGLCLSVGISGCTENPSFDVSGGSAFVQVPWLMSSGEPEIQMKELKDLQSLRELRGRYVKFYMQPHYVNGQIQGQSFSGRFSKKGKEFFPTDVLTSQLSAVYAHFQGLYELDQKLNLTTLQTWPRKVAVVTNPESSEVNGAFFDNDRDFYIFVPYTFAEVPVMANGGVIAHEHFHSHFSKLVLGPLREAGADGISSLRKLRRLDRNENPLSDEEKEAYAKAVYQSILVRGLNEGLADFWAFLYTQDRDFLLRSLPKHSYRSLKISDRGPLGFFSSSVLKAAASDEKFLGPRHVHHISMEAYVLGNHLAKKLVEFVDAIVEQEKISLEEASFFIAQELIQVLPLLKKDLLDRSDKSEQTTLFELLKLLVSTEKSIQKPYLCEMTKEVIALDGGLLHCPSPGDRK